MTHWHYHSLLIRDLSICESKLNAEGEKGWELVSVCLIDQNTARAFFKMPLDSGEPIPSEYAAVSTSHPPLPIPTLLGSAGDV